MPAVHSGSGAPPGRGLLRAAGSVAGLTLVSRALGFLRWVVQATCVGAGTVAGAYSTANQVPNVLYEVVVGGALAATVVPLLAAPIGAGHREQVSRTASGLLGVVLLVLAPPALVLALAAGRIAELFPVSQGVDPSAQRELVTAFLRMFALQVPLYGVGVVLTGVLQAHGRFTWPALTPVASSLTVMATYGIYGHLAGGQEDSAPATALSVLGWGTTLGVAALSLPLIVPVRGLGLSLRPTLHLERAAAARALRLGGAGVVTLVTQQLSVLAVLALARQAGATGTVAVYQYTQAVYVLPFAVLVVPVSTVLYPRLAAALAQGRAEPARTLTARSTALVAAVATAGAGMLLAAGPGAERFFSLLTDVEGMGTALAVLAPGLVGYALLHHLTRVLFAADASRAAAWAGGSGWLAVGAGSWTAVRLLAPDGGDGPSTLVGLGLGATVGMLVAGAALAVAVGRRLGATALAPTCRVLAAAAPVALLAGLAGGAASRRIDSAPLAVAAAMILALAAAGLVILAALAVERSLLGALRHARSSAETRGPIGHAPEPASTPEPPTDTTSQEQI